MEGKQWCWPISARFGLGKQHMSLGRRGLPDNNKSQKLDYPMGHHALLRFRQRNLEDLAPWQTRFCFDRARSRMSIGLVGKFRCVRLKCRGELATSDQKGGHGHNRQCMAKANARPGNDAVHLALNSCDVPLTQQTVL